MNVELQNWSISINTTPGDKSCNFQLSFATTIHLHSTTSFVTIRIHKMHSSNPAVPHLVFSILSLLLAIHASFLNQCTFSLKSANDFSLNCQEWSNNYQTGMILHIVFAMIMFVGLVRWVVAIPVSVHYAINGLVMLSAMICHSVLVYYQHYWSSTIVLGTIYTSFGLQSLYPDWIEVRWATLFVCSLSSAYYFLHPSAVFIVSHVYFLSLLGVYGGKTREQHVTKHFGFYIVHAMNYLFCFVAIGRYPNVSEVIILLLNSSIFILGFLTHALDTQDSHALEFFANVAQLWSYRFLQPVWSHWSSNLLLMTSIGNLTLLTLGKMNTMDMDNVNLVDDFNGLHSQVYLRSFFSLPMILAFRSDNIILSWIALLFVILGLYLPYPATALKRMKHVYLVEQSPID
jgi:hypothetical protein